MCKESSYVFMLRDGADSLEVQYNEQSEGVYLAEAQIFVGGEHINGGCYFDIDNIEDMDRFISYLKELREKIKKHNEANPDNFHVVKPDVLPEVAIPKSWLPGPVCKKCSKDLTWESLTERQNLLCFDCERKQIIKSPDNFNRVSCIVCEGEFDNPLQKQLGICGKCMKEQSKANKRDVGNYVDKLKSALTPEQKELIDGVPKQVVDFSLNDEKSQVCKKCGSLKKLSMFPYASMFCHSCLNDPKTKLRTITPTDITKPGC